MDKLKNVADMLRKAAEQLEAQEDVTYNNTGLARTQAQVSSTATASTTASSSTVQEVRRLFSPYRSQPTHRSSAARSSCGTAAVQRWSHKFLCFADQNQEFVPDKCTKLALTDAGLGEKKLVFDKNDDEKYFHSTLISYYTKLKNAGGFELMRSVNRTRLETLPVSRNGYTTKYLANDCCIGQAILYIRPLQLDLDMTPVAEELGPSDNCVKEKCMICDLLIPVATLRKHLDMHKEQESTTNAEQTTRQQPICSFMVEDKGTAFTTDSNRILNQSVRCPVCQKGYPSSIIATHSAVCGDLDDVLYTDITKTDMGYTVNTKTDTGSTCKVENEEEHRDRCITETIQEMSDVQNPKIILLTYSRKFLRRQLDVMDDEDDSENIPKKSFEIFVSRENIFDDMLAELSREGDLSFPLDVTFVGEEACDLGGPRREFLTQCLQVIKDKVLMDGALVTEDTIGKNHYLTLLEKRAFEITGVILGLSLLEGGPVPKLFEKPEFLLSPNGKEQEDCVKGLKRLGIVQLCQEKNQLLTFFDVKQLKDLMLSYPSLVKLLKPQFSEDGSNHNKSEKASYRIFIDYLKEVAAHRRGSVQLEDVLKFVTGLNDVPAFGFSHQPSIQFTETTSIIPTSSTCTCSLFLQRQIDSKNSKEVIFGLFDYAFSNNYFGLV